MGSTDIQNSYLRNQVGTLTWVCSVAHKGRLFERCLVLPCVRYGSFLPPRREWQVVLSWLGTPSSFD